MSWYEKLVTLGPLLQQDPAPNQGLVKQPVYTDDDAI